MSTVPNQEEELKGGHPPAVKVGGGVRITQRKEQEEPKSKEEVEEEKRLQAVAAAAAHDQRVLIAGAPSKGDKDFSVEAVKSFHEKPLPTVQMPHTQNEHFINQPRRH